MSPNPALHCLRRRHISRWKSSDGGQLNRLPGNGGCKMHLSQASWSPVIGRSWQGPRRHMSDMKKTKKFTLLPSCLSSVKTNSGMQPIKTTRGSSCPPSCRLCEEGPSVKLCHLGPETVPRSVPLRPRRSPTLPRLVPLHTTLVSHAAEARVSKRSTPPAAIALSSGPPASQSRPRFLAGTLPRFRCLAIAPVLVLLLFPGSISAPFWDHSVKFQLVDLIGSASQAATSQQVSALLSLTLLNQSCGVTAFLFDSGDAGWRQGRTGKPMEFFSE